MKSIFSKKILLASLIFIAAQEHSVFATQDGEIIAVHCPDPSTFTFEEPLAIDSLFTGTTKVGDTTLTFESRPPTIPTTGQHLKELELEKNAVQIDTHALLCVYRYKDNPALRYHLIYPTGGTGWTCTKNEAEKGTFSCSHESHHQ